MLIVYQVLEIQGEGEGDRKESETRAFCKASEQTGLQTAIDTPGKCHDIHREGSVVPDSQVTQNTTIADVDGDGTVGADDRWGDDGEAGWGDECEEAIDQLQTSVGGDAVECAVKPQEVRVPPPPLAGIGQRSTSHAASDGAAGRRVHHAALRSRACRYRPCRLAS